MDTSFDTRSGPPVTMSATHPSSWKPAIATTTGRPLDPCRTTQNSSFWHNVYSYTGSPSSNVDTLQSSFQPRDLYIKPWYNQASPNFPPGGQMYTEKDMDDWEVLGDKPLVKSNNGADNKQPQTMANTAFSHMHNSDHKPASHLVEGPTVNSRGFYPPALQKPAIKTENIEQPINSFLRDTKPKVEDGRNVYYNSFPWNGSDVSDLARRVNQLTSERDYLNMRFMNLELGMRNAASNRLNEINNLKHQASTAASRNEVNALSTKLRDIQLDQTNTKRIDRLESRMEKAESHIASYFAKMEVLKQRLQAVSKDNDDTGNANEDAEGKKSRWNDMPEPDAYIMRSDIDYLLEKLESVRRCGPDSLDSLDGLNDLGGEDNLLEDE
ncbi:uncharacterized protein GGS22DRAFT_194662 [Annulohypoxylon maeteangense]|uniref:uncharacterized protein n=1 Tax=Annulohypoxylon maeteangense TaxID=1927788 RepID=UPI00200837D9|nr:uncharacterized protein GGS22DRAFT_194662 [Annulohypoxylon maeteangense]KAI0884057.1 hypothetical protein GGS22DRAFT_194662 [Annulohypoxylon maeteangense]